MAWRVPIKGIEGCLAFWLIRVFVIEMYKVFSDSEEVSWVFESEN
jgi:hypothetical protein